MLARITITGDPVQAAEDADLLSESVPEQPKLKGQVLGQFNELCPPHTIFTTNSSSLVPSQFAGATGRPDRFCAFHFHQLVWMANVVDIMPHPGTAAETAAKAPIFEKPDSASTKLAKELWKTQKIYIVGESGNFYGFHNPREARKVVFAEKKHIKRTT